MSTLLFWVRKTGAIARIANCICVSAYTLVRLHTVNFEPFETLVWFSSSDHTHTPQWPPTNVCRVSKDLHCGNQNPLPKSHLHQKKKKERKTWVSPLATFCVKTPFLSSWYKCMSREIKKKTWNKVDKKFNRPPLLSPHPKLMRRYRLHFLFCLSACQCLILTFKCTLLSSALLTVWQRIRQLMLSKQECTDIKCHSSKFH